MSSHDQAPISDALASQVGANETQEVGADPGRLRAERALSESESKYRALFDSIDRGFCIIEVMFDDAGTPVDYVFLEANPAFVSETGLTDAIGRSVRAMVPGHEQFWFETYGRIARTGRPERFEHRADALGRWYDVYAFRVGMAGQNRVSRCCSMT